MSQAVSVARTRADSVLPRVAGMLGNVLEWYDFAAYGFLAATFAANFFPLENRLLSLMASYGVFAVAFVTRPLGAVVFGHVGDRVGRRKALIISWRRWRCHLSPLDCCPPTSASACSHLCC